MIRKAEIKDLEKIRKLNLELFNKEFREFDNTLDCSWPLKKEAEDYYKERITKKEKLRVLNARHKNILRKRYIVEHSFAWIKNMPILNQVYEKTIVSYKGLLMMGNTILLANKIIKERNN